jgi:glycosyltransferase involved in cell wall biosynthesis
MEVLQITTTDSGGAGRAADRLNQGLQSIGVPSQMLVQKKTGSDYTVLPPATKFSQRLAKLKPALNQLPLSLYPTREKSDYSLSWLPDHLSSQIRSLQPHIINLHWICDGYLEVKNISKFKVPVVWTLHDMWAFTGGCHYIQGCDRYTQSCGHCPQLKSRRQHDLSFWQWRRKAAAFQHSMTFVSPSHWLAAVARSSPLLKHQRIEVIPNGLDAERYKPINRQMARTLLQLPQDKHLILFGAMQATDDKRKGFHWLKRALQELSQAGWNDRVELVVFGASRPDSLVDSGFKVNAMGKLHDDVSLALLYAAADVFVAPSTEDNLPNTVMEALACGTPCIAFQIGGMPDLIEHRRNGYLARPYEIKDFMQGMVWILEDPDRHRQLCHRAREKVEQEFTLDIQACRYASLYQELLLDAAPHPEAIR